MWSSLQFMSGGMYGRQVKLQVGGVWKAMSVLFSLFP